AGSGAAADLDAGDEGGDVGAPFGIDGDPLRDERAPRAGAHRPERARAAEAAIVEEEPPVAARFALALDPTGLGAEEALDGGLGPIAQGGELLGGEREAIDESCGEPGDDGGAAAPPDDDSARGGLRGEALAG